MKFPWQWKRVALEVMNENLALRSRIAALEAADIHQLYTINKLKRLALQPERKPENVDI